MLRLGRLEKILWEVNDQNVRAVSEICHSSCNLDFIESVAYNIYIMWKTMT